LEANKGGGNDSAGRRCLDAATGSDESGWSVASLIRYGQGKRASYRVDFSIGDKRKTIRLGKAGYDEARTFNANLELLLGSRMTNTTPRDEILRWLTGLPDKIHEKLAQLGLADARKPATAAPTLRAWLDRLIEQRPDLKPASVRSLRGTGNLLIEHLGDVPIDAITADVAADWRAWMTGRPIQEPLKNERTQRVQATESDTPSRTMAEASIRLHCRNAKAIMGEAVRRELLPRNPFRNLTSTAIAADRARYITPEETDKIIDACPDIRWRLLVGLARLAGLRVPSETHSVTWGDVDFDRWRLTVRSVKTERFAGKESRIVPIVPKLQAILQDAFDKAEPGQERVVSLSRNNLHRTIRAAVKRAGVSPWSDLFQALRRSCETEWSLAYPAHVCADWLGHSECVSRKHYLQVPEGLYEQATQSPTSTPAKSAAKGAAADAGTERLEAEVPGGGGNEKIAESPENIGLSGVFDDASCRTRTYNPLIKSQLLCQVELRRLESPP